MQDPSKFDKLFISLRYRLLGLAEVDKSYLLPLKALEYAKDIHTGLRKDGVTPEFQHQVEISSYTLTLSRHLLYPAATLAVGLLHDVPEDYDISFNDIDKLFGEQICHSVELLTKKYKGTQKQILDYFTSISKDPISSIIKGGDRINNHQSMIGVFTDEKIISYMKETQDYIIPMLKVARREFVEQEGAYENVKFLLNSQISLINHYLKDRKINEKRENESSKK